MKNISLLFLTFSLFVISFSGCGKKKSEERRNKTFNLMTAKKDIPTFQFDENEFFDNEEVADFAFVDNDDTRCNTGAVGEIALAKNDIVANNDDSWDDDFSLAYDDEDVMDSEFKVVNFDINKNSIRSDQKQIVVENTRAAKELTDQGKTLVVSGHCCPLGSASYNMSLSERRAKAIKDEMIKSGVVADKIRILGCGSENTIVLSDAKDKPTKVEELAPNRRAEIIVN